MKNNSQKTIKRKLRTASQWLLIGLLTSSATLPSFSSVVHATTEEKSSDSSVYEQEEFVDNGKIEKDDSKSEQNPTSIQKNTSFQNTEEPLNEIITADNDDIANGIFGTAEWKLDSEGTLHIGSGEFDSTGSNPGSKSPWLAYASQIKQVIFEGNVLGNENSASLFSGLSNLESIQNLNLFDTSQVTNMNNMFSSCVNLTSLDVSTFDTSRVTDMGGMFAYNKKLLSLNVTGFDVSKVSNLNLMFGECSSLKSLDTSTFYTPVNGQGSMFAMFRNCSSLEYLDLSGFDTSRINPNINRDLLAGTTSLSKIKLGEKVRFTAVEALPAVPNNSQYTGKWQNIGTGTPEKPNGEFEFTSEDLMLYGTYDGSTMADTYVWQPVASNVAADVTVNYVDEDGKAIPSVSPQTISGNVGDSYDATTDVYKLAINGYTLDESKLPTNAKGTLSDKPQTVTYVYKQTKDQSTVIVHDSELTVGDSWKPEDNFDSASDYYGNVVPFSDINVEGQVDTAKVGTYKVTYTRFVPNFFSISENQGTYSAVATVTVKDAPPVKGGDVTAKYIDTDGNKVSDDVVKSGNVGDAYTTEQKAIEGYTFKEVQGNTAGQFTDQAQTVTYVYTKNEVPNITGTVLVEYVNTDGNKISEDIVKSGTVGEGYSTEKKDIKGYTFKEVQGSTTGQFTEEVQTVTYVYTKNKVNPVNPEPKPENKPSLNDKNNNQGTISSTQHALPATGENERITMMSIILGLILIALATVVSIFRFKKVNK